MLLHRDNENLLSLQLLVLHPQVHPDHSPDHLHPQVLVTPHQRPIDRHMILLHEVPDTKTLVLLQEHMILRLQDVQV